MNAYTNLSLHLDRHKYTKGAYKGQAPADTSRRAKTHFRVANDVTTRVVRFHSADILTAYQDGTILLHTNGWHDSPTTRKAMRDAIYIATGRSAYLYTVTNNGLAQTAIDGYRYYDGMKFDSTMKLLSEPAPSQAYRVDPELSKEFRAAAAPLRAMLPVLIAAESTTRTPGRTQLWYSMPGYFPRTADRMRFAFENPEYWPTLVAFYFHPGDTAQTLWARLYREAMPTLRRVMELSV